MLPNSPCFIVYIETLKNCSISNTQLNKLANKYSVNSIYFFTHNSDVSIKSIGEYLKKSNIEFNYKNIMTPTSLLINYCKTLLENFSVYPITNTNDTWDFYSQNIKIDYTNPEIIFICTNKLNKKNLQVISNTTIPIAVSSNICHNRFLKCANCLKACAIKNFTLDCINRFIIPDPPPTYTSSILFKQLNIQPQHTVLITNSLRDDYIQYKRSGCKIILLLQNKHKFKAYLKSPHDIDIVVDNFDKLLYFLNLK